MGTSEKFFEDMHKKIDSIPTEAEAKAFIAESLKTCSRFS